MGPWLLPPLPAPMLVARRLSHGNKQGGGWEPWLKSMWSGSQDLGSSADSADDVLRRFGKFLSEPQFPSLLSGNNYHCFVEDTGHERALQTAECWAFGICIDFMIIIMTLANIS